MGTKVTTMAEETAVTTDELLDLINDLADTSRCHYDHHGYCQEHGWFDRGVECPHARASRIWDMSGNLQVTITTPNTRQRAERAATKIIESRLDLGLCKLLDGTITDEMRFSKLTDIIAAEFEK